jgi:hypothetical protein
VFKPGKQSLRKGPELAFNLLQYIDEFATIQSQEVYGIALSGNSTVRVFSFLEDSMTNRTISSE